MPSERVKIVVWDSIGNTLLGVRPWESWDAATKEILLREDAAGEQHAPSFAHLFAAYDVELIWFNSARIKVDAFGPLLRDYEQNIRFMASVDELAAEIPDTDYLVVHKERLPDDVLRTAGRLKLLQHLGQDFRWVPTETAREMGVPVTATPLVNYLAVAEHVWALILNAHKRLPALRQHMRARAYGDSWGTFPDVKLTRDYTLGLLGLGEIARPIARIAQAFEMRTVYWDIERFPDLEAKYDVEYIGWDDVFRQADLLSVQLALNDKTEGIIGEREIGLMKPSALFINTARGKLVDQPALTRAVAERRIDAVALDVFAQEPLPTDDPLLDLQEQLGDRVTLTPHCAWQSPWTWVRDSQEIWQNVLASLEGRPLRHLV